MDERPAWSPQFAADTLKTLAPVPPLDVITPEWLSGGVFGAATMPERFERALVDLGRNTTIMTVVPDPLDGVFLIAREGL